MHSLDGTECAVKFGSTFNIFEVKNNSSAPVLMALSEGAAAGDDGVVSIPAGGSFCYPHMINIDTVYLTGNGEAAVVAKNTTDPSFKSAPANGQGGGGTEKYVISQTEATFGFITYILILFQGAYQPMYLTHHKYSAALKQANVFTLIGNRMKGRRACWSVRGGNNLAALLCKYYTDFDFDTNLISDLEKVI